MQSNLSKILAIVGPTASGKTALSILIAKKLNGQIISADSRQIYKYLDIGTAKPTIEERANIPHHFIDFLNPDQDYNAGEFGIQSRKIIQSLQSQNILPILVGGSGLYIRACIEGFFDGPGKNLEIRNFLEQEATNKGGKYLFDQLKIIDPISASNLDETKIRRIIRALEVYKITGKTISELHKNQQAEKSFATMQFALDWERKVLYDRINQRVDLMLKNGLLDEINNILKMGYQTNINSLNTVGYKEAIAYLNSKISKEEMIRLIKQNTRHFAKRQLTWFRADKNIKWIKVNEQTDWNLISEQIIKNFI